MDKKLIGLLVTAAVGLSACGSSGGMRNGMVEGIALGDAGSSSNSSGNSGNSGTGSTTTTTTSTYIGNHVYHSESALDVNGETQPTSNYLAPTKDEEINVLQVEGRSIQLVADDKLGVKDWVIARKEAAYTGSGSTGSNGTGSAVHPDGSYSDSTDTWTIVGNQLQYAKFGELYDQYEKRYRFAQGNATPTANMPTTRGEVKYSGHATYSPDFSSTSREPTLARSEFIVDFGEKAMIGQIQPLEGSNAFEPVTLKAVISENQFKGVNTTENSSSKAAVAVGAFYGPNAEEVAGVYYYTADGSIGSGGGSQTIDPEKPNGTFGATKQ